jgi:RNA polymerase sigma factor (sigma-70 family)
LNYFCRRYQTENLKIEIMSVPKPKTWGYVYMMKIKEELKKKRKLKNKERNKREPKENVDILMYEPLIWKVITKYAVAKGNWVYDYKEELKQIGYLALISAFQSYDPERGTFVTIAWLRIDTHISRYLRKQAIHFRSTNHLEDLNFTTGSNEAISWQDLFPSSDVDIPVVCRLAVSEQDDIDWKLLNMLIMGERRRSIPNKLGLSRTETNRRIEILRENLVAVCNEIYGAE